MIQTSSNFKVDGRTYYGGKFGFNADGVFTYEGRTHSDGTFSNFFTGLAISTEEYRLKRPTQAAYRRIDGGVMIIDDWGAATIFELSDILAALLMVELEAQRVPRV